jgi:hypothetical protein
MDSLNILIKTPDVQTLPPLTMDRPSKEKIGQILSVAVEDIGDTLYRTAGEFDEMGNFQDANKLTKVDFDGKDYWIIGMLYVKGHNDKFAFDIDQIDVLSKYLSNIIGYECLAIGFGHKTVQQIMFDHGRLLMDIVNDFVSNSIDNKHIKVTSKQKILLVSYDINQLTKDVPGEHDNIERYFDWLAYFRACVSYFDYAEIEYKIVQGIGEWLFEKTTSTDNDMIDAIQPPLDLHTQLYGQLPTHKNATVDIVNYEEDWFGTFVTMMTYYEMEGHAVALQVFQHMRQQDGELIQNVINVNKEKYLNVNEKTIKLEYMKESIVKLIERTIPKKGRSLGNKSG